MTIFYDLGNAKRGDFDANLIKRMNPNSAWANHSYNHLVLSHIFRNSPDPREKIQAGQEIDIAERKMKFWARQPGFDESQAEFWRKKIYRM